MTDEKARNTGRAAREKFARQGLYCAESVLQALAEENGVTSPLIPRIATGLCSGMSRTGGMCGALSGGVLALSMMLGRDDAAQDVDDAYDASNALVRAFEERFGGTTCPGLLGCDLATPEGQQRFNEGNLGESRCRNYVRAAAEMAAEILADRRNGS